MAGPGRIFDDIKAKIYDKFIQIYVLSKTEVTDHPGYIITRITSGNSEIALREFVFPETLFSKLETEVVAKFGEKGRQALYSAGKRFGYQYAKISDLATLSKLGEKKFKKELYNFIRYIETIYAEGMRHEVDVKQRICEVELNQYIVCRLNGLGHILTEGAIAGTAAYMSEEPTIEGVQTNCQGRGDRICKLICAPAKVLEKKKLKFLRETDYSNLEMSNDYPKMNELRTCKYATQSFKDLVDAGFYTYSPGVAKFGTERYLICESSIMYLIEMELQKIGAKSVMFDVAFETGKAIGAEHRDYGVTGFLTDFLSSLGYGDVYQSGEREVLVNYFPWTHNVHNIKFTLFRGLVSGLLSGLSGEDMKLKKVEYNENEGFLSLVVR